MSLHFFAENLVTGQQLLSGRLEKKTQVKPDAPLLSPQTRD